ncbi:MAG: sugar phosphate isomerase/epimerase [Planctomycetes bacterium]|nr:sugar phosphate isomerase/epimerase [Planctomycetota bacterium]
MKSIAPVLALLALASAACAQPEPAAPAAPLAPAPAAAPAARDDRAAEALGWQLGVQAWTFRDRTTFEAIDTAKALGLRYIELYGGQKLAPDGDTKVGPEMPAEQLARLRGRLEATGVKAMAFGVTEFSKDEAAARRTFAFAKALGIGTITCEPDDDAWDLVERLADEYGIAIGCHNHPKPSRYANPEAALAAVKDRSKRLGACADTGHWLRSGVDPVEALRLLEGRIRSLHFKDVAPASPKAEDKPWGTGECKAREMLAELRRQGFRGLFSIEYEWGKGKELEANVARCIAFFDAEAKALHAKPATPGGAGQRK